MCIAQNHAPFFQSLSPTSFYLKLYPSYFYHSLNPAHWLLLISINPASSFLLLKPASHKQSKIQQSSTNLSNNLWIQLPSTKHWIHDPYNNIWIQHFILFAQSTFLLSISTIIYHLMNPPSFFFSLNPCINVWILYLTINFLRISPINILLYISESNILLSIFDYNFLQTISNFSSSISISESIIYMLISEYSIFLLISE